MSAASVAFTPNSIWTPYLKAYMVTIYLSKQKCCRTTQKKIRNQTSGKRIHNTILPWGDAFLATQKSRKRRRFKGGRNSEISSLPDEHIQPAVLPAPWISEKQQQRKIHKMLASSESGQVNRKKNPHERASSVIAFHRNLSNAQVKLAVT
jgi:hypothetical protein